MKAVFASSILVLSLAISQIGWAAEETVGTLPAVEHYQYGMNLDIDQVVSLSSLDEDECQVQHREMLYKDSAGALHRLDYEVMNTSVYCTGG